MPNKPSKKLLLYLQETGAVHGTPEDIARAKDAYRKLYKKAWKQTAKKNREVRATFTADEYSHIQQKAEARGMTPTTYVRELALAKDAEIIPHRDTLLLILQKIRMAAIRAGNAPLLDEAEQLLTGYLNRK